MQYLCKSYITFQELCKLNATQLSKYQSYTLHLPSGLQNQADKAQRLLHIYSTTWNSNHCASKNLRWQGVLARLVGKRIPQYASFHLPSPRNHLAMLQASLSLGQIQAGPPIRKVDSYWLAPKPSPEIQTHLQLQCFQRHREQNQGLGYLAKKCIFFPVWVSYLTRLGSTYEMDIYIAEMGMQKSLSNIVNTACSSSSNEFHISLKEAFA